MNTEQDPYAPIHTKLREGLQILSEASEEEKYKLNAALIKLHSALEDFLRIRAAQEAPHLRGQGEDVEQTTWDDLLTYGEQYLGFTENDARLIRAANRQCQAVAHGDDYSGSRAGLVEYGAFVERWCRSGEIIPADSWRKQVGRTSETDPPPAYSTYADQPWYRSTLFLVLTFFLLPPVWAILILTDRGQGRPVTLFAYTVLALTFLCGIGVVSSSIFLADHVTAIFAQLNVPLVSTRIPPTVVAPVVSAVPTDAATAAPIPPTVVARTDSVCTIVWVEHPEDNLARRSRSWVWEEIVKFNVEGSGMTPREFYDLVVEHNPVLEADDYEFMEGRTYLLPECQ